MNSKFMKLSVLGARGSVPIEGKSFEVYGGATSCYRVQAGDEEIYLDAGSGIVGANPLADSRITILLTHMHLDHVTGLPFFDALKDKNRPIKIYAKTRNGLTAQAALDRLISPPFWPLKLGDYPADVTFSELSEKFFAGEVAVDTMEGNHPQGSTIYRLSYLGKSLVYATDFEHTPRSCESLARFARDCDLLLYDGHYTEEEYEKYRGYGHSTPQEGLKVANVANVKQILFVHHSPQHSDEELSAMERELLKLNKNIMFAKIGDEIFL